MSRYVVKSDDARRVAGAVVRYQVDRPTLWIAVIAACVLFALGGHETAGARGALLAPLACLTLVVLVIANKRGQLTKMLRARGYRPGAVIESAFDDAGFTVSTESGSTVHPYEVINDASLRNGIVVLRLTSARIVLALPVQLVPQDRFAALADGGGRSER